MSIEKKEVYVSPEVVKHELLRDITATKSGGNCDTPGYNGFSGFSWFH